MKHDWWGKKRGGGSFTGRPVYALWNFVPVRVLPVESDASADGEDDEDAASSPCS